MSQVAIIMGSKSDFNIMKEAIDVLESFGVKTEYDIVSAHRTPKNMIEYARGLSSFTSEEIIKIKGQHSNKIQELLGYIAKSEVVHKDDMVAI